VLSGRGLCDELITRLEKSYGLWYVVMCDLETPRMRRPWPALDGSVTERKLVHLVGTSILEYYPTTFLCQLQRLIVTYLAFLVFEHLYITLFNYMCSPF
jgi:hypothetical protein